MASKRKHSKSKGTDFDDSLPVPAPHVGPQLGALLKQAGLAPAPKRSRWETPKSEKKAPAPLDTLPPPLPEPPARVPAARPAQGIAAKKADNPRTTAELRMLNDAYAGARPLTSNRATRTPVDRAPDARAQIARQAQRDNSDDAAARERLGALVAGGVHFDVKRRDEFVQGLRSGASNKLLARLASKAFVPEATLDLHGKHVADVGRSVAEFVRSRHRSGARQLLIVVGKGLHSEDGVGVLSDAAVKALTQTGAAPLVLAFGSSHASQGGSGALSVVLVN